MMFDEIKCEIINGQRNHERRNANLAFTIVSAGDLAFLNATSGGVSTIFTDS